MSNKNIAIKEDVYKKLKEVKGPDKSFSDAIEELLKRKGGSPASFEFII